MDQHEIIQLIRSDVHAFNEWRQSNPNAQISIAGESFIGESLIGIDLHGVNLELINFLGADLYQANFQNAYTKNRGNGPCLMGSDLRSADMQHANLAFADMKIAQLMEADCLQVDLMGADLSFCDFRGANLQRANLEGALCRGTDFRQANLIGVNFHEAEGILLLNMIDPRGFVPLVQVLKKDIRITSENRYFTVDEARSFWSTQIYPDSQIADRYQRGLDWLEQSSEAKKWIRNEQMAQSSA